MTHSQTNTQPPLPCETTQFTKEIREELARYRPQHVPRHVAIIPDGNRRWAKKYNKPILDGYMQGAQTLIKTALTAKELGTSILTMFSFSTENWKRPNNEQTMLWELFVSHLKYYKEKLIESGIRLSTIGNVSAVPPRLQKVLQEVQEDTKDCSDLNLVLAMNYGGRDEIVRAFQKLLLLHDEKKLSQPIDENTISSLLDTCVWPDPDLIIRTAGEQRLSNFLLWQSSYSELYIENQFWPDFSTRHFVQAIDAFQSRSRRLGGDAY